KAPTAPSDARPAAPSRAAGLDQQYQGAAQYGEREAASQTSIDLKARLRHRPTTQDRSGRQAPVSRSYHSPQGQNTLWLSDRFDRPPWRPGARRLDQSPRRRSWLQLPGAASATRPGSPG